MDIYWYIIPEIFIYILDFFSQFSLLLSLLFFPLPFCFDIKNIIAGFKNFLNE